MLSSWFGVRCRANDRWVVYAAEATRREKGALDREWGPTIGERADRFILAIMAAHGAQGFRPTQGSIRQRNCPLAEGCPAL